MKTVLIVDDEADLIDALTVFLQLEGYHVIGAVGGQAGLSVLHGNDPRPDLLLLDMMMPEVSGTDVLEAVRSNTDWAEVPVLLMSASNSPPESEMSRRTQYIRKPFELDELLARVARMIEAS